MKGPSGYPDDALKGKRFLVVDDYLSMRKVLNRLLTAHGAAEVLEATSGTGALKLMDGEGFDAVILDWMLTDISGMEVLKEMKKRPASSGVPVIMLTSKTTDEGRVEAVNKGVFRYLEKPSTSQKIMEAVIEAVTGKSG